MDATTALQQSDELLTGLIAGLTSLDRMDEAAEGAAALYDRFPNFSPHPYFDAECLDSLR